MIAATGEAIAQAFNELRNLDRRRDPQAAPAEIPRYRPQAWLIAWSLPASGARDAAAKFRPLSPIVFGPN